MIDYMETEKFLRAALLKSHTGQVLVERIETNKHGTTYRHKHWVNPDEVKKTDKVLSKVSNIVYDKDSYLKKLTDAFKSWIDSFTKEERKSLTDYTMYSYEDINSYWRGNLKEDRKRFMNPEDWDDIRRWTKDIESALSKSEVKEPMKVFREVPINLLDDFQKIHDQGGVYVDNGFVSSTVIQGSYAASEDEEEWEDDGEDFDEAPSDDWSDEHQRAYVEMVINVPKCKGMCGFIQSVSTFPDEHEFLFNRGAAFKISGITKHTHDNGYTVNCTFVGRCFNDDNEKEQQKS